MASEEQYEDRPREYTEGSPDVDKRVPGAVSSSGYRETQRDVGEPVRGERSTSPAYEMPSEPVPADQPQAGADFGNDPFHATAYDQSTTDEGPADERGRGEFGERWSGEPADSEVAAESFGAAWSNETDVTEVKAAEFGERWAVGPDDSAARSEEFGAAWSGDNQPERDV
jgi:hypothetical protein